MSLPATDSFTGTNGDPLSANWTTDDGAFAIYSNSIRSTDSDASSAWWDADSFNNDQYCQADVAAAAAWKAVGLVVRRSAANSLYFFEAHTEAFSMQKLVSGSWTEIASGGSIATSDVIRYEASGTTITPKKNGSTTGTPGAQTDTSLSSGSAGIWFYAASGTDTRLDNWEGGNISSGISGSLSKTLDGLTKTIDGDVAVDGDLAKTLDGLTKTIDGDVAVDGDLAKTLDGLTKTIDGDVAVDGDLAKTLDDLSKALAGAVDVVGALDKTLDGYTLSAAGTVTSGISGSLSKTLGDLTKTIDGDVTVDGDLSKTLGDLTKTIDGDVEVKGAVGTPPITDEFTAADGTSLTAYSANWTIRANALTINTNAVYCSTGADGAAYWNADTFDNDQYSQCKIVAQSNWAYPGVIVRCSTEEVDYYKFVGTNSVDASYLEKIDNGASTQLSSGNYFELNDVIKLEVSGTTLTCYINGSTTGAPGAQTDTSYASGQAGICAGGNTTASRLDDWEGGNLAPGTPLGSTTLEADGTIGSNEISGSLSKTLDDLTKTIDGDVLVDGDLDKTLDNLSTSLVGTVLVDGTLDKSLDDLSKSISGTVTIAAALDQSLQGTTLSGIGNVPVTGSLDKSLDSLSANLGGVVIPMTYARPANDAYDGLWTDQLGSTVNLYDAVNEAVLDDDDYIRSEQNPTSSAVVLALSSVSDPLSSDNHILRYRYGKSPVDTTETFSLAVELRQGYVNESDLGTLIASWEHPDVGTTLTTAEQALSQSEADSITNYSSLFVRMVAETV